VAESPVIERGACGLAWKELDFRVTPGSLSLLKGRSMMTGHQHRVS
jgi:hypothetical protein